jgi:hypothetical protein
MTGYFEYGNGICVLKFSERFLTNLGSYCCMDLASK